MTTLDISGLLTPHDLLKVDWSQYLVRWDDGQPRKFRVPFKPRHDGENVYVMFEVKYRRLFRKGMRGLALMSMQADSRNLSRIEILSDHEMCPVILMAYRGRLFVKTKSCNQLTLPLE